MEEIKSFRGNWGFLSNFYPCALLYEGREYESAEAAYQAAKCASDGDKAMFAACHPAKARKIGKIVAMRADWEPKKVAIMKEILLAKFEQNPVLMARLLATYPAKLIEGNTWHDNFWGACTCKSCFGVVSLNTLGVLLEKVRADALGRPEDQDPA